MGWMAKKFRVVFQGGARDMSSCDVYYV